MPYKIGGGFKLEAYDPDNGQYTEEQKIEMKKFDEYWLRHCRLNNTITLGYEPHIPTKGIHNFQYAFKYIDRFKHYLYAENNPPHISDEKCFFLLNGVLKPKRTKWLENHGFYLPNKHNLYCYENQKYFKEFQTYIINNTDFNTLYFFGYAPDGCMMCNAITTIDGYKTTTGWKINQNFQLNFVTLIESTERYYEKKNQIRW